MNRLSRYIFILCACFMLALSHNSHAQQVSDNKRLDYIRKTLLARVPNAKIFDVREVRSLPGGAMVAIIKYDNTIVPPYRSYWKEASMIRPEHRDQSQLATSYDYSEIRIQDAPQWHLFTDNRHNATMYVQPHISDGPILALIDYIVANAPFKNIDSQYHHKLDVTREEIFRVPPKLSITGRNNEERYELELKKPQYVLIFKYIKDDTFQLLSWDSYEY